MGGPVDEHECKLVIADRDAVAKGNIHVDNVEVLGRKSIDWFTGSYLGNGCVGAKGEGELASVAEDTAIGCEDNMFIISKPMTTGQSMELLRGEHHFRVRRVRGVAWADGWEARLRVMEVSLDFVLGCAVEFFGRASYLGGVSWRSRVVVVGVGRGDGGVFKRVDASNQIVVIEVSQASQERRWWYERHIEWWRRWCQGPLWPVGRVLRHDIVVVIFIFDHCRGRRGHGDSSGC